MVIITSIIVSKANNNEMIAYTFLKMDMEYRASSIF